MKKFISTMIIFTLVLSLSTTAVFADNWKNESGKLPPGLAKKGFLPPGIAKKVFDDIDGFSWAEKAIARMAIKGMIQGRGNNRFAPAAPVNKLETVIMALRVMGWEEEAKEIDRLPEKYDGKKVHDWAVGYVALAYEKGILDEVDMMYFDPYEPAKRHEVAKYVIRALGYEEEAQDHMDEELPFVDALAVPQGSVGYVYLMNELGLMQGDDQNRFNPMGTLKRAEMAVLFSRLDKKVDSDVDYNEVIGKVYRIHKETIVLKVDGELRFFELDDKVKVYKDNKLIRYKDIEIGSNVIIELKDDKVVYIEVIEETNQDKIITKYSGVVKEINANKSQITI
ncbi:S-layer homology domain-containing protein [Caldisalinibacter kiritimatiensis]|uniref:S-layer protein n=1 Tax=Caldisalinibacter kiritimatiensis TaxID=1304284 RepID=R1CTD3_9FIRM|nr:S-layer homology domain-containing protein [Caldisalinibacter kiritimatiensis]EOD01901.1 S-layer protein [Caldisalinibacter kiritimatiensis]